MHSKVDYKRERPHKSLTTGISLQGKYITYILNFKIRLIVFSIFDI